MSKKMQTFRSWYINVSELVDAWIKTSGKHRTYQDDCDFTKIEDFYHKGTWYQVKTVIVVSRNQERKKPKHKPTSMMIVWKDPEKTEK